MKRTIFAGLAALFSFGIIVACSSDDDNAAPVDNAGSCAILASQCHPYDDKSALGHECHELGHAGDDTKCGPRLAECQAACPKTDSGDHLPFEVVDGQVVNKNDTGTGEDAGDAASDVAAPTPCALYCECLIPACGSQAGFPYADAEQCKTACAGFSDGDVSCRGSACENAKALSEDKRKHECDHAIGTIDCH